jgi:hypothetical protein
MKIIKLYRCNNKCPFRKVHLEHTGQNVPDNRIHLNEKHFMCMKKVGHLCINCAKKIQDFPFFCELHTI